jgi:DNA end-binding protein Ku
MDETATAVEGAAMARAMWRGAIQFGLVTIPVKLYLATEARGGLSFNLLHRECLNRIQMKTHCPEHGEIPRSDTVRGFEYSKGQYVVIDEQDFESVPLKTVRSIEIELFTQVDREAHEQTFVRQAYYLEPEPVGRKAFYLLKSVLADEGLAAICKIVLKDREALASLNPYSKTMVLTTLYWPDEVRAVDDLDLPEQEPEFKSAEKKMAQQLIAAMKGEFRAEDYRDEYREALTAVIEAKVEGRPAEVREEPAPAPTGITDLMSVLEASVNAARQARQARGTTEEAAEAARKPAARRRKAAEPQPIEAGRAKRTAAKQAGAKRSATKSETKQAGGKTAERRRKTA